MSISDESVQEFKRLYKEKSGEDISDEKAREMGENLVRFFSLLQDMHIKELKIEEKLKSSPNGFDLTEVGSGQYTCMICGRQISGIEGWRDKYGNKCLVCQKAVDDKLIEGWILEDIDNWYKMWEIKDKLDLHHATIRKMVREEKLKTRVVPGKDGKPFEYLFIAEENYSILPPKGFEKRNMLLMSAGEFFTEKAPTLYKADFSKLKIAYINTATKKVPDDSYSKKQIKRMKELNWNFKIIDIAKYSESKLCEKLNEIDIIYVEGGNTFYLLDQIRKKKFDQLIKSKLNKGALYAGVSAGSYVVCPTIEMALWGDSNDGLDRCGITNFRGMSLVPFVIKVHMTPKIKKIIQNDIKKSKFNVKLLTDKQALLIHGGEVHLVE
jgi:dipeptidase E